MQDAEDLSSRFRTTVIIGYSMLAVVFLYGVVGYFVIKTLPPLESKGGDIVTLIFLGLSILLIVPIRVVREAILEVWKKRAARGEADLRHEDGLFVAYLISFGMCELVAILGVVACVLRRDLGAYPLFAGMAFLGLLYCFPRWYDWQRFYHSVQGGTT